MPAPGIDLVDVGTRGEAKELKKINKKVASLCKTEQQFLNDFCLKGVAGKGAVEELSHLWWLDRLLSSGVFKDVTASHRGDMTGTALT